MTTTLQFFGTMLLGAAGLLGVAWCQMGGKVSPRQEPRSVLVVEEPTEELLMISKRIRAKTTVVERLLANELTLFEAAAWFRELNAQPASLEDCCYRTLPGADLNEKLCRQVICWVEGHLSSCGSASELSAWTDRLENELIAHLASNGRVILPEPTTN